MKLVELECPNCGAALQKTQEKLAKCPHCGTEFLIDEGQPENVTNIYNVPQKKSSAGACFLIGFVVLLIVILVNVFLSDESETMVPNIVEEIAEDGITSEFFQEFVSRAYNTSYDKVSEKELAEITYLNIFWENDCDVVEYARNDGSIERIEMPGSLQKDCTDIRNFKGLKTLKLPGDGLTPEALEGLDALTEVWAYSTPEMLAAIVEKPENLTVLGCYDASSLIGIDAFKNLEYLYVSDYELTDINALSALKNLKQLEIAKSGEITDFGVLHSLTGLEMLSIKSEGLKDISFVQNMASLKELSLEDTIILDVSVLEGKTSVQKLKLKNNDQVQDFGALSSLTGLETLELDLSSSQQMPDASGWQNLSSLSISGADDIRFLSNLPNLKSLTLAGGNCEDFDVLASLQNLEELKIGNIYGDLDNLNALTCLPNLKLLDISAVKVYGNVESLFGIQSLEELNINDCSFGLDFDAISENTGLKRLYMSRVELLENISVAQDGIVMYVDYDKVNLADHIGFLGNFPNLEELYLQGNKLTDVAFTENLQNLKKLDITNNYVTDLRPLGNLSQLETVWCGENSISQGTDLGEDVTVILDSEADEGAWWK